MSQDYSDDVFGTTQQVQANMQQIEDNFAALKSAFSGASAPPDPVAGMWWLDTTTHLLKIRNEANSAWQSVWNLASNKPVIANLSGEITGAMIATAIKDAAAGTASLRTLGTAATSACAGNDSRLSDTRTPTDLSVTEGKIGAGAVTEGKLGAAAVAQAKLKTSTGEVNTNTFGNLAAPGGEYGFWTVEKKSDNEAYNITVGQSMLNAASTSYAAYIYLASSDSSYYAYAQQRYISSSGKDHWIYLLLDKVTKKIIASYQAPDHPSANLQSLHTDIPHPFPEYDATKHEIVCADNSILESVKPYLSRRKSILSVITERCIVDDAKSAEYEAREIRKINEYPDEPYPGFIKSEVIAVPDWAKILIKPNYVSIENFAIESLPENVLFRKLYLNTKKEI